jgi:hypothetical protein
VRKRLLILQLDLDDVVLTLPYTWWNILASSPRFGPRPVDFPPIAPSSQPSFVRMSNAGQRVDFVSEICSWGNLVDEAYLER